MNLNFSLFLIHIYFNAVEASPDRKKVKISDHEENSFKNHETLAIIDGIDYLGFAKIFSHQSKPLISSNPIEGAISSDRREISNATGSDSKTYIDEPQLTELDTKAQEEYSLTFQAFSAKRFYDQKFTEADSYEDMSQKGSQLEFSFDDVSSYMELNSTEKVQEFHCEIYPNDFEVNRSITSGTNTNKTSLSIHQTIGKNNAVNDSSKFDLEFQSKDTNGSDNWKEAVNKLFIKGLIENSGSNMREELISIVKDELEKKIEEQDRQSDVDSEEEVLSCLKNKESKFYCNKFKSNSDFKEILNFGRRLVSFEKNSYSNLSTSEIMQKIDGYHLINYANELRKTKIHLIVPELNYLLDSFEENIIDNILHGNALLIHYYYEITKIIINLILTNSNKVDINIIRKNSRGNEKMEGKEEKSGKISKEEKKKKTLDESEEVRLLDIRRIFFIKRLLSELFPLFQYDSVKIEIYKTLNLLYFISHFIHLSRSYLRKYFFRYKMNFLFRFLFDSNIYFKNDFNKKFIEDILGENENGTNPDLFIKNKLTALFRDYFCLDIFFYKGIAIIETYKVFAIAKDKDKLRTKTNIIAKLKEDSEQNLLENIDAYKNRKINIFLKLEFEINHSEYLVLSTTISIMNFYKSRGPCEISKKLLKESNKSLEELKFNKVA
ncbi:hypothetical protein CWI38_1378p0020 [Hamiltosporidium tvaerminnensis]|uniref:Uncharacterized protein n=1 Tax=Hamiltosporidium tvaerminnensis TaxID=1176355 RepID=A0A4Q9LRP8_9MICR|nr:hypothetical protein CWI38_1378p0020 [Hamiltosporidium tvaerminnensis]